MSFVLEVTVYGLFGDGDVQGQHGSVGSGYGVSQYLLHGGVGDYEITMNISLVYIVDRI